MKYVAYTDGSSRGNPGAAGWATIVMNEYKVKEYNGRFDKATNNQMEIYSVLFALNFALQNLNKDNQNNDEIEIHSDSEYTVKGCNEWIYGWVKNNWKNSQKKEVLNRDLWEKIFKAMSDLKYKHIKFSILHVRGHSGHLYNERADRLCTAAALKDHVDLYDGDVSEYKDFINKK